MGCCCCQSLPLLLMLLWMGTCCRAQVYNLSLAVDEGLPPGTLVGDIRAGLPEGSPVEGFFLSEEDGESAVLRDFHIDTETGIVRTLRILDRERRQHYSFVAATLLGDVVQVDIKVQDVNDHSPTFPVESLRLQISELTPPGTTFRLPAARDPDTGEYGLRGYSLIRGSQERENTDRAEKLQLEGSSTYSSIHPLDLVLVHWLDREELDRYQLEVEAFDGGYPRRTGRLLIDITVLDANDNPPSFDQPEYNGWVWENAPAGTPICTVHAMDPDLGSNGEVRYTLRSDEGYFLVEETSGIVRVNRPLDREQKALHQLVVQAKDGGSQPEVTSVLVIIKVLDVNDNKPHIQITLLTESGRPEISEGARIGEYLARISVSDPDLQFQNVSLTLEGSDGSFSLRHVASQIYFLCVEASLDREIKDLYELKLIAKDSGSPPLLTLKTLLVVVTDLNDEPPVFMNPEGYHAIVSEAASAGTAVLTLKAQDLDDEGPNSRIAYTLQDSAASSAFTLDSHTGVLSINKMLDFEAENTLNFVITATDHGVPPLSTTCTVTIMLEDVNDNEPIFMQQFYNVTLLEHSAIGHCFLQNDPAPAVWATAAMPHLSKWGWCNAHSLCK
ncbi:hypothetical protein GDO81_000504 [Engystomops pustulosus]|uniref:Cadherin domain-containing protein n=1 Tax=Engystomops pustulosus TaxID=76066 RepID=A0AAV7D4V5_ENGPU|nr:hypothetical protein GDO81_000504 [Engystomops pustulosus]